MVTARLYSLMATTAADSTAFSSSMMSFGTSKAGSFGASTIGAGTGEPGLVPARFGAPPGLEIGGAGTLEDEVTVKETGVEVWAGATLLVEECTGFGSCSKIKDVN